MKQQIVLTAKAWCELTKEEVKKHLPKARFVKTERDKYLGIVKRVLDEDRNELGTIFKTSISELRLAFAL